MGPGTNTFRIARKAYENVRQQDRASFFEDEGLTEFLHLKWDIEVEKSLVLEFIENYHLKNRTVKMSTGEIAINDDLIREAFHLPMGSYKMPKRKTNKVVSPYFPDCSASSYVPRGGLLPDNGFVVTMCNDEVWKDRFFFLHLAFSIKTRKREVIPYYFIEFLQADRKNRHWFDAFKWFFEAEIARIKRTKGSKTSTTIGTHISLLLAHLQNKKALEVEPKQNSLGRGQPVLQKIDGNSQERQSASDDEGDGEEKNVPEVERSHPSLNIDNVEDQILRHYDVGREGINQLLNRMTSLRNEVDLRKRDYGNRIGELRSENDCLKHEVEKWKNEAEVWKIECGKVEQGRKDLEEYVAAFWKTTKLGSTGNTTKLTRPLPEDNTSSGFATPQSSKKTKVVKLPKIETDRN